MWTTFAFQYDLNQAISESWLLKIFDDDYVFCETYVIDENLNQEETEICQQNQ